MLTITKTKINKGFTTIELLFYILGMVVVLSAIFYLIVNLYSFYKQISTEAKIDTEATIVLNKIIKDLRTSSAIDLENSILNNNESSIVMTQESNEGSINKKYALSENRIVYQENMGAQTFLSLEDLQVSKFNLKHLVSPISEAVKIELEISYETTPGILKNKNYSSFVILRNSYKPYE